MVYKFFYYVTIQKEISAGSLLEALSILSDLGSFNESIIFPSMDYEFYGISQKENLK